MKVIEGLKKADLDWFPNAHDDILYECLCQTLTSVRTVCLYSKRSLTKFWSSQGGPYNPHSFSATNNLLN